MKVAGKTAADLAPGVQVADKAKFFYYGQNSVARLLMFPLFHLVNNQRNHSGNSATMESGAASRAGPAAGLAKTA